MRDRRVLKRAWIRENSSARTLIISSIASCPVQITHTELPHSLPIFSVRDWRFKSISVSVPTYCPASSTMNKSRKFFGLPATYALMSSTNCAIEKSTADLSLNQFLASSSDMPRTSISVGTMNFPLKAKALRCSIHGLPFFSSNTRRNSSVLPLWSIYFSSIATFRFSP